MNYKYEVGQVVIMKKPHPCGGKEWQILKTGIDFRIKCCKCGHQVMIPQNKFIKNVKKVKE